MKREQILPTAMIVLAVGAALFHVPTGDWRKALYWLAAATLNFVVTY